MPIGEVARRALPPGFASFGVVALALVTGKTQQEIAAACKSPNPPDNESFVNPPLACEHR